MPAVPIAELPGAAGQIGTTLESIQPRGTTPSGAALQGAIDYARTWVGGKNRRVAIALSTDGEPTFCGEKNTIAAISTLAASAAGEASRSS